MGWVGAWVEYRDKDRDRARYWPAVGMELGWKREWGGLWMGLGRAGMDRLVSSRLVSSRLVLYRIVSYRIVPYYIASHHIVW